MGNKKKIYWSNEITRQSNALDLEPDVFTLKDSRRIARSLKRSAEASSRRKGTPFQSAMSMLNFYINRAGKKLPSTQCRVLERAKDELRKMFGRKTKSAMENKIKIIKAKILEAKEICDLENQVWGHPVVTIYETAIFIRYGYVYIAKDTSINRIVGTIVAFPTKTNTIYVCDWVVSHKYQRMGIGEKLYKKFLKEVVDREIIGFIESKNKNSLMLHKNLGFDVVRRIKSPFGIEGQEGFIVRLKKL